MPSVELSDRTVLLAAGPDAESLLQNVITTDLASLAEGEAKPGALLTPQGKILFDFVISRTGAGGFRLDCRRDTAEDLAKRLTLYKLRAKMEFSLPDEQVVSVSWESDSPASQSASSSVLDRRFPEGPNVVRHYGSAAAGGADLSSWHHLRVEHGVAESGSDYALGEAFPHEVLFDQNGGVGLKKGCYVGQEVVSRMHHRGTARRRLVIVRGEGALPASGAEVTANGRPIGTLGTVAGEDGLAILRIDRAAEAMEAAAPITAGEVALSLRVPAYAGFSISAPGGQAGTT
ncbi:folate-binding protein YgfZ [Chelativorans sp. AA-79]|uniref:CAF17-like 4Fe-4S cluster assembly/insertion protein YgfZ n=1 Tax=Chelativorans sp. AA-79 TaxID=3028735 RepID=UPI0023F94CDF|nr:folate-binding protein YgfZ [Chelativorans sp. AA-79]WEX07662.1 folate-binding protein YgfZ [Chelativorans sp. AA-79]